MTEPNVTPEINSRARKESPAAPTESPHRQRHPKLNPRHSPPDRVRPRSIQQETTMRTNTSGRGLRRRTFAAAAVMAWAAPSAMAADADTYPSRPITIIVPSVAGNVTDAVARLIGRELTKPWKQE